MSNSVRHKQLVTAGRTVLIVSQGPNAKNWNPATPLKGVTTSSRRLEEWCARLGLRPEEVVLTNATDKRGRPALRDLRTNLPYYVHTKTIALGEWSSRALLLSGATSANYFCLPHPSCRNLRLKDEQTLDDILEQCKIYLEAP